MRGRDLAYLLILAAIWGGSFLFMRIAVFELGAFAMIFVRLAVAAMVLLPVLFWRGKWPALRARWRPIAVVGCLNSAIPFVLIAYAARELNAGLLSIMNAVTPLAGAAVAWVWLKESLPPSRVLGLALGMAGILILVWDTLSASVGGPLPAVLAGIAGPCFYGLAACYTKRYLTGADTLACTTGGMTAATALLAVPAFLTWPQVPVSAGAWAATVVLGVLCTGFAYLLLFQLIARVGPQKAITVTFLVPVFGVLWGWLWLDEVLNWRVIAGALVVLAGTALATGVVERRAAQPGTRPV